MRTDGRIDMTQQIVAFFYNLAQAPKNPAFLDSNWNLNSSII